MTNQIKTYSELIQLITFEERFEYVKTYGALGEETFGGHRYINQQFYRSKEWKDVRQEVILRDKACDLAFPEYEIAGRIYIHHLNPITIDDIVSSTDFLMNPEYLVCVSFATHNALHYGSDNPYKNLPKERSLNDMCPWKRG